MQILQYNTHLILQSKYKFLVHLFILSSLYLSFYGPNICYCMMEEYNIPVIAEAMPTIIRPHAQLSNIEQLIHRNIDAYIGDKALITEQQTEIARLTKELDFKNDAIKALDADDSLSTLVFENDNTQEALEKVCTKYKKPMAEIHPDFDFFDQQRDSYN